MLHSPGMSQDNTPRTAACPPCRDSYHHGDLHNCLLDAANCLLEETGAEKLSLREVAKRAGVSHTAPYRHFRNRQALLEAVAISSFQRLTESGEQAERSAPDDPVAQLRAAGVSYLELAVNNPEHTRLIFGGLMKDAAQDGPLYAAGEQSYATIFRIIDNGRSRGVFGGRDTESVVLAAWSLVHGLAMLILGTQKVDPRTPEELTAMIDSVVDTLLNGILRAPTPRAG